MLVGSHSEISDGQFTRLESRIRLVDQKTVDTSDINIDEKVCDLVTSNGNWDFNRIGMLLPTTTTTQIIGFSPPSALKGRMCGFGAASLMCSLGYQPSKLRSDGKFTRLESMIRLIDQKTVDTSDINIDEKVFDFVTSNGNWDFNKIGMLLPTTATMKFFGFSPPSAPKGRMCGFGAASLMRSVGFQRSKLRNDGQFTRLESRIRLIDQKTVDISDINIDEKVCDFVTSNESV
ncbi:hypothetical protein LINPERHAP2_LOCUS16043 [Linum perenne]